MVAERKRARHEHELLPGQGALVTSQAPEFLYSGAFGSGKSTALCWKGVMLSVNYPGNRGAIFRKTAKAVRATTLITLLLGDPPHDPVLSPRFIRHINRSQSIITLRNGSQILYGGCATREDATWINSLNLGWAAVDQAEELTERDWMMLLGRLRLNVPPVRQIFAACNPSHPGHFLYKRFFAKDADTDRCHSVQATTFENIHNLPADYIERMKAFVGPYRERYVFGRWISFAGRIYDIWDEDVHLIEPFDIPPSWKRYRVIDFGFSPEHAFVCQWWAEAPDGTLYMYREIYQSGRLVEDHAKEIKRLGRGERIEDTYADHDAEDRATLHRRGILTTAAVKEVGTGIQEVYSRLQPINGVPRLFLFKNARAHPPDPALVAAGLPTCTAEEFPGYVWAQRADGTYTEQPVKGRDHGLDATRYLVRSLVQGLGATFTSFIRDEDEDEDHLW